MTDESGAPADVPAQSPGKPQRQLGPALVTLTGVNKHFGPLHVLRDIDLSVQTGEVVVVIGPSGSGKSTLCRAINRLESIDTGTIQLDGKPLPAEGKALAALRSEVGMVFQSFNLFAHKTVLQNVTLGPSRVRKLSREDAHELGMNLLERVGVANQSDKYPAQLSGGQQQRVACARALMGRPDVIFADEPTGNLDSRSGAEVLSFLRASVREHRQTIVMVTHDAVAASYADRVIFLADGEIVSELADPTPQTVLDTMKRLDSHAEPVML